MTNHPKFTDSHDSAARGITKHSGSPQSADSASHTESTRTAKEIRERCGATVWTPEQLRYTGRGKHGFERHYIEHQCKRYAFNGGYCRQHQYKIKIRK